MYHNKEKRLTNYEFRRLIHSSGLKAFFTLTRFALYDLKSTSQNVILLFVFICAELGFVFQGGTFVQGGFIVLNFTFLTFILVQTFSRCFHQDLEDSSLEWLFTQRIPEFVYFLSKCLAFMITTLIPLIAIILAIWWCQQGSLETVFALLTALLLSGLQIVLLSGSLSLSLLFRRQGFHLTLPICLLPLQVPTLIILQALEGQQISPASALMILLGLCLLALAASKVIVQNALGGRIELK